MPVVNLSKKFGLIHDFWHPRIVGELNDSYVKLAKLKGEFVWHKHETEDELFLVIRGRLTIRLREGDVTLGAGEFFIVPHGVEHMPATMTAEVEVMLLEPKSTVNTGLERNEKTVDPEWI